MKRIKNSDVVKLSLLILLMIFFAVSCKEEDNNEPLIVEENTGTPCPGMETFTYGGQVYHTVQIGSQCWLRENLNIGDMLNSADTLKDNDTIEKYCYGNDPANCEIYGGLYTWEEIMNYGHDTIDTLRGICPEGWHIATDVDWKILESEIDSLYSINDSIWDTTGWRGYNTGGNLKITGFDRWYDPNIGAKNTEGFTALPGGIRYAEDKSFDNIMETGFFWTSTKEGDFNAWFRLLSYAHSDVKRSFTNTSNAFSVRCVKD